MLRSLLTKYGNRAQVARQPLNKTNCLTLGEDEHQKRHSNALRLCMPNWCSAARRDACARAEASATGEHTPNPERVAGASGADAVLRGQLPRPPSELTRKRDRAHGRASADRQGESSSPGDHAVRGGAVWRAAGGRAHAARADGGMR